MRVDKRHSFHEKDSERKAPKLPLPVPTIRPPRKGGILFYPQKPLPEKTTWKPGTMLNPVPAVMVSCGDAKAPNIITVAWAGTVCSEPPMVSISIRPERYSYGIIKQTREFVINLTTTRLAACVDFCGMKSGRNSNKFVESGMTPGKASVVSCPVIVDSPVNIECKVKKIVPLGSHDMFIADIVAVDVDKDLIDKRGKLHLERASLLAYAHGQYFALGKVLGKFGYSIPIYEKWIYE